MSRYLCDQVDREKYVAVSVSYDEAGQKTDSITVLSNLVGQHSCLLSQCFAMMIHVLRSLQRLSLFGLYISMQDFSGISV